MIATIQGKYDTLSAMMNERLRRRWAGCEALALGRGEHLGGGDDHVSGAGDGEDERQGGLATGPGVGVLMFVQCERSKRCSRREDEREQNEPHGYSIIMRSPCCGANR